jgi:hypothetical protein
MPRTTQWLNSNQYRRYPFVEDADLSGPSSFALPDGLLLDCGAATYQDGFDALKLTQVQITQPTATKVVTLTFEYQPSGTTVTVEVPETAVHGYRVMVGSELTHHLTCTFGVGVAELVSQFALGTYTFTDAPEIEPALIVFHDRHRVSSVEAVGVDQDTLTGDIHVEAGFNCVILVTPGPPWPSQVVIRASKGAGAGIPCDALDDDVLSCNDVLLRINGLPGSDDGQFNFVGGPGVEVVPDPDNNQVIIRRRAADQDEMECETDA